ncbi:DNA-directed RNA polymerase III subunit RPC10 [Perkinsus chesapeaki]|uniref:DNA-directed RNA polymerase III subunit RPC10 n=1 Tax=Perkinsus chesapeaki TaxID=330153 RepID=A0A7J6MK50_PERCH|nr:DNA-directed RNA polymerase III subunit RPC10 [Perkinsus chesapeaki]
MSSYPLELSAQEQAKADGAMCGSETYHKVVDSEAYAKTKQAAGYVWDKTCQGYDYLLTKSEEGLDLDRDGKSQLGRSWSVLSTATGIVWRNTPRYVREARDMVQKTCVSNSTDKDANTELTGSSEAAEEAQKVPIVDDIEKTGNVTEVTEAPAKPVGLIRENDTKPVGLVQENSRVDPVKAHNSASVPPTLPGVNKKVADNRKSYGSSSVPTSRAPPTAAAYKSSVVDSEAFAVCKQVAGCVWQKSCEGYDYLLTKSEEGLSLQRGDRSQLGRTWNVTSTATCAAYNGTKDFVEEHFTPERREKAYAALDSAGKAAGAAAGAAYKSLSKD